MSNPSIAWNKAVSASCLSGEGKGLIGTEKKKSSFSFESLANDQKWLLAVSIPLLGEEALELQFSPYRVSGEIYDRLQQQLLKKKISPKMVEPHFKALAAILKNWQQIKKNPAQCSIKNEKGMLCGECFSLDYQLKEESLTLLPKGQYAGGEVLFSDYNGRYFETTAIQLPTFPPIELLLKFKECGDALR